MILRFDSEQDKVIIEDDKTFNNDELHSKAYIMKMELNLRTMSKVEEIIEFNHVRLTM